MRHTRKEVAFRGVCLLRSGKRGCEDILLPLLLLINVGYVAFGEEYFFVSLSIYEKQSFFRPCEPSFWTAV